MKSSKQRRLEIKAKRRKRAEKLNIDTTIETRPSPLNSVEADHNELTHNNTYGPLPLFYIDKVFVCCDCNLEELWTAKQQKWWYEVAKGHIDSTAVRCRKCRDKIKSEKDQQRKHMEVMANKKPHSHDEFFKNT